MKKIRWEEKSLSNGVSRLTASKCAHILIPGICGRIYYLTWQRDYENVIKGMGLRWGDYPGLSGRLDVLTWVLNIYNFSQLNWWEKCYIRRARSAFARFESGRREPQIKNIVPSLESRKDKEMDSPFEPPERKTAWPNILNLVKLDLC